MIASMSTAKAKEVAIWLLVTFSLWSSCWRNVPVTSTILLRDHRQAHAEEP
jgi:hypothetical protein